MKGLGHGTQPKLVPGGRTFMWPGVQKLQKYELESDYQRGKQVC